MLCVVCPHCHQMMTAPVDAVGESVACPGCKKNLQVPPNAPRLPKHLSLNGAPPAPAPAPAPAPVAHAKAPAAALGGRVGAAVAAPPAPGAPPAVATTAPTTKSTFPKGLFVVVALVIAVGVAAVVIVPKLGTRKAVVSKKKDIPNLPRNRNDPLPPSDLTAAALFKAYFDNSLAADEHYKDREVTLAGRVAAVGQPTAVQQGDLFVDLHGVDRSRDLTKRVRCYFDRSHKDRLTSIATDQPLKIRGTCKGTANGRIVIRDCSFVSED